MPYVHFASPGAKQACPTSAACWSPSAPATGTPGSTVTHVPNTSAFGTISGSIRAGTSSVFSSGSAHSRARRSISIVRLAFVTSVT